jgi:cysteine desulfurase
MHANNEVGTVEPIREIADIAHARDVRVHTDGAQSVGKIPTRVEELGVDLFSVAGHKLYAPKGIGALYVRKGTEIAKIMHGASHERNMRAGTENVLEIVGLGMAAEIAGRDLEGHAAHMKRLRDRLHGKLREGFADLRLNGHPERRLPNTLSVSFPGRKADAILAALGGVAASAGAACHADEVKLSHVLEAMGIEEHVAMGTVRLSVGRMTTEEEIDRAAQLILEAAREPGEGC